MSLADPSDVRFSPHEAHPYRPSRDGEDGGACALCGERREQIRHHPTRVRAACLLRGIDPEAALETAPASRSHESHPQESRR